MAACGCPHSSTRAAANIEGYMETQADREVQFWIAHDRIMIKGDAAIRKDEGRRESPLITSPTRFQPISYRRFTRQEANVVELVV